MTPSPERIPHRPAVEMSMLSTFHVLETTLSTPGFSVFAAAVQTEVTMPNGVIC